MVIFYCRCCIKITNCAVHLLWLYIPESLESSPLFSRTLCFLCILITMTLNLVWHCCLHLQLFGIPMDKLKRRTSPQFLVSGGSKGSFNIRGKKRQHRISRVTLYELFLKNEVNKTWDTKPWILITCLRL